MGKRTSNSPIPDSSIDLDNHDLQPVSVTGLFNDASLYNRVIADHDPYLPDTSLAQQSFADLVGEDLGSKEKDVASRFAQLSAEEWTGFRGDTSDEDEAEPVSDADTSGSSSTLSSEENSASSSPKPSRGLETFFDATERTICLDNDDHPVIPPEQLVNILIQEFGQLGPDGSETLLAEIDGAIIQDVVILGVVHVTTHRLTFHASLPSSDPTLTMKSQVLKSGSVTVHRKGLHWKRRAWLELSSDFISLYPSAREEDRIRPLRSARLGSIREILPENPEHPRYIKFTIETDARVVTAVVEFDTIESTRSWRRDFSAALFYFRRKLRQLLANPGAEELEGVRINIPLDRIERHTHRMLADVFPVVSFIISCPSSSEVKLPTGTTGLGLDGTQVIDLAIYKANERWDHISEVIALSKYRAAKDALQFPDRPVVIDFGLGNSQESLPNLASLTKNDPQPPKSKEATVCKILAIEYTPDVWGTASTVKTALLHIGFLVVSPEWVGFWSKSLALQDLRYRLSTTVVRSATKGSCGFRMQGVSVEIEGQNNLNFFFRNEADRDEAINKLNEVKGGPVPIFTDSPTSTPTASASFDRPYFDIRPTGSSPAKSPPSSPGLRSGHKTSRTTLLAPPTRKYTSLQQSLDPTNILKFPKAVNLPPGMDLTALPRHFVCLTIGSRGDVQPYIALGLRLKKDGHTVTIVTHPEYKDWIVGFGLAHRDAGGDPGALMQLSVENKMFSPQFIKQSLTNYRTWLDALLLDSWNNCQDADVLLESPYAMAGVHIAEALHIPYFRVCTMPWTKTTQFPHPFIGPPVETPAANALSYVLFDNILWAATAGQVNRWRREHLKIDNTTMGHGPQSKIPVLYNFSSAVVPKPLDWSDSKVECGYWFLDNPDHNWGPPESLLRFMREARDEFKPLVYIGFGSITVPDPQAVTEHIYQAVKKSDVRAIVSRGWSSRMAKKVQLEVDIPDEVYVIDKVPHDWLFPQVDAALHHGGAGTTGASLRAGIPTLIKPWFGDQYFWASRVQKLGAGLRVPSLRVSDLANALTKATSDRIMKEKAAIVGQKIRSEDGCQVAMRAIYTYLPRASSGGLSPE
ncbi:hypothetical protein BC835DRAFT_1282708 [Cytidiella melzeri]|nr:hypothetical protein BC835DRAFT_1282708 [Cytidiella melzeri]